MADHDEGSVLFIHHRDLTTPVGTTVPYYLSNELSDSHTVHVVCRTQTKERDCESNQGAVLHDVNTGDVPVLSPIAFHVLSTLLAALLGIRYRYTVVYSFQSCLIQGWLGARFGGSRFVVGLQSVPVRQRKDFDDFSDRSGGIRNGLSLLLLSLYSSVVGLVLERSSDVVCLTDGIAAVTEEAYGVDLSNAHVLGMGVDVETFSLARPGCSDDRTGGWTLTYLGHVSETRGLERVFEALAEIDPDVTLQIAGQGPADDTNTLVERVEALNVSDQVEWLGLIPHEEVPQLLSSSDFTISPLPDIESYRVSFPAKLLEYMAAGTLVIATDIPPHRRLIEDGANGYLYDGSCDELAATIERAVQTGDRSDLERRARQTAETYDWDVVVGRYEAALFDTNASKSRHVASRKQEAATD